MERLARLAAVVLAVILALGALVQGAAAADTFAATSEETVRDMVNATRSTKGLRVLIDNDGLRKMARDQALRMEKKGNIFHNLNLGGTISGLGLDWLRVGENVGMGPNIEMIENAFLASPGHYANIIRPEYNAVGIGVVDSDDGKQYVVQVFANLRNAAAAATAAAPKPESPAQAPAAATKVPATPKPAPATPEPTPVPVTAEPNALTGGSVRPIAFPPSDLGKHPAEVSEGSTSAFGRLVDILAFWA